MKRMLTTNQKPANTNRYTKTREKEMQANHQRKSSHHKERNKKNRKELQKQVAMWQ